MCLEVDWQGKKVGVGNRQEWDILSRGGRTRKREGILLFSGRKKGDFGPKSLVVVLKKN